MLCLFIKAVIDRIIEDSLPNTTVFQVYFVILALGHLALVRVT